MIPRVKPRYRGRLHQVAAMASVPAALAIVVHATGWAGRISAAVYGFTLICLYGVSALYHVHHWEPEARLRMKRLDHGMIFVFIAGCYTPFSLLVLEGALGVSVLVAAWIGAVIGVAIQLHPRMALHKAHNALYIVLGWLAVVGAPQTITHLAGAELALLVVGGVLYTLGAILLATRWPDPWPAAFGFHEVWHAFVLAASVCHYALMWDLVT